MTQDAAEVAEAAEIPEPAAAPAVPAQATSDQHLIALWLHGRSPRTRWAYHADVAAFLAHAAKPLRAVTLGDVQAFADGLGHLAPASQARRLSAVKSLLGFGHRLGFLAFDVGAPVKPPAVKQTLAERILDEQAVATMLALEPDGRNKVLLRLLYLGGLRIGEACALRLRDLAPNGDAGQVTIFGKGGRTRVVLLKASIWQDLARLREVAGGGGDAATAGATVADPDAPVFRSRKGGGTLDPSQVHRVVKAAAQRAGLPAAVSAYWLRHAHVSHALDRGAPAHLVQATVGHASLATTSRYAHARPGDSSSRYLPG